MSITAERVIVYTPWPREAINEAVTEFNAQMHDGAGCDEIRAGLHGLDFLTRRSDIDDALQARLDGAITEAHMRLELLGIQEAEQRTADESRRHLVASIKSMQKQVQYILDRARSGSYGEHMGLWPQEDDDDDD